MAQYEFKVTKSLAGQRLDLTLLHTFSKSGNPLSRRKIRRLIDMGSCYVDRRRCKIASKSVLIGQKISIDYCEASLQQAAQPREPLQASQILHHDSNIIVINKPPFLASEQTRAQSVDHLIPWLQAGLSQLDQPAPKLILAHRLDKETSGVIVLAKTQEWAQKLHQAFRDRAVEKTYLAICHGKPDWVEHTVDAPLHKFQKSGCIVRIDHVRGKSAITNLKLQQQLSSETCLIMCSPKTGRTHQIRVHLASIGHGIIGDKVYYHPNNRRSQTSDLPTPPHHLLHASAIRLPKNFGLPEITAPAPISFQRHVESPVEKANLHHRC